MCSVVGCDSWQRSALRFMLPEDPERRLEWVQFLFEVNGQRFKESSWTDITICSEHFTADCFGNVTRTGLAQLKSSAVPSLCIKSEPEEFEAFQEPLETTDVTSQCDELKTCDSPSSCSEESKLSSVDDQESPVPSEPSDAFMSDYGQMLHKVANIDIIREKAALLQMKKKYVVNENRLLQLFSCKCPLCGSGVKVEKFTYGVLIILNQQCLECEYRKQWKSQVKPSVPISEDQHLTGGVDVTAEIKQTDENSSSEMVSDEERDPMDEGEESGDEGDADSDDEWTPMNELLVDNDLLIGESDEESESGDDDELLASENSQLCTDCGKFFNRRKRHTCEHKIKPYSCNICGKRCVSEVALNSHSRVHDENYEHLCKYCHLPFKTKVDKLNHEQTHLTQGKPYKCPDCSETFASNKERRIHLVGHRGPRQMKCHICGIEFYRSISLRRHLLVHTGVKAYKCSVCDRGFNQASHLKSHMRLHTGERPYKCQHCGKCFNHNVSLKSHVQRYHTSNSGRGRKKGDKNKTVVDAVDSQENEDKKGTDLRLDNIKEDHKEKKVQKERTDRPKRKRRSTGRPIGRPKRNPQAQDMRGQLSNTETAKVKVRKLKRTLCSDEESEGEPTESDTSFDSAEEEEEERSEKVASSTGRSRGRTKNSDSDSDFDPEERKKKRYCSQNGGTGSGKRRGRQRKNQEVEDT